MKKFSAFLLSVSFAFFSLSLSAATAPLSFIWVDPYHEDPNLPYAFPPSGIETNSISLAAAIGEVETVSFSVLPSRNLKKVDFVPSDLKNSSGDILPASAADFALVKVWFRAGDRWLTSWAGRTWAPELINDIVIHDNDLIRVDEKTTNQYLRIDYPDPVGTKYVDIRNKGKDSHFDYDLHPVRDPKKFVPFDLEKDRYQQYWLTYRIPSTTKPGIYRGTLAVSENGSPLTSIPIELEVYPFTLPRPRTHYDTTQPFISHWMGVPTIADLVSASKRLDISEIKARAIYRDLAEHSGHNASFGDAQEDSTNDLAIRTLLMMREEGITLNPVIGGAAADFMWVSPPGDFPTLSAEDHPDEYQKALNKYKKYLDLQNSIMDKYLGHRNRFYCSVDECGTGTNRRSYGFWRMIHEAGSMTWTDYGVPEDISAIVGVNDVPASARHSSATAWHRGGAKAVTYAGTFTGPSCPALWRRLKGLRYYYADFDGQDEYCYFDGRNNRWNDTVYHDVYCQFGIVYLTYDGLISTLAWEGMREGTDDIRYLSLLRMRAEAAMKSPDPKIRKIGRAEFLWMDSIDPEAVLDLFAFRRDVARRISRLIKIVGPQPPDPKMPIPAKPLPPSSLGKEIPAGKSPIEFANNMIKQNRYDIAIPVLDAFRKDDSKDIDERIKATITQARLHSVILERHKAIAIIDEMLARPEPSKAQRGQLLLRRLQSLTTDVVFEECYSLTQLNEAANATLQVLKAQGLGDADRFSALLNTIRAYEAAGEFEAGIEFADARLEDTRIKDFNQAQILVLKAQCNVGLGDRVFNEGKGEEARKKYFRTALSLFRHGRDLCDANQMVYNEFIIGIEARIAEHLEDWKHAQRCYSSLLDMYGTNPDFATKRKGAENKYVNVTKKLSAETKVGIEDFNETSAPIDISLDE